MIYDSRFTTLKSLFGAMLAFLVLPVMGLAQITLEPKPLNPIEAGILYNKEQAFTTRVMPRGLAFGLYQANINTYYRTTFYSVELGYQKHHKEVRQSNEIAAILRGEETPRPYVYGKQNSFYTLRASYGVKRYFSEKAKRKGMAVGLIYQGGFTLGILKPYHLRLIKRLENNNYTIVSERFSEENREVFLDPFSIYGGAPLTAGLNQLSVLPGAHGMIGVHFAFGAFDEYIMALDAGLLVEVFPRRVPIMIEDNKAYFLNLFLNLHIGKRK